VTAVLVDTNVIVDALSDDERFGRAAARLLDELRHERTLLFNGIVYAELAVGFENQDLLDQEMNDLRLVLIDLPRAALFLAGKAFHLYRRRGGAKTNVLPDSARTQPFCPSRS
jgi:predicted nucleic acid-binding protein